ncbi:PREDICTED: hemolymph lipopolysaccharide-binding protein isoform X1 [Wasmannia auropunctata]|uniref:hemolymph lipopolysaccharide-binding protein isoform X1 n=1 Tax=Wasmannia auropunctata TaxID=64793 RepID=UPI0005EF5847|nr:PREDICTED: hemolymph lipopolysaccharide-binding protein isoform X1 [Wasmannia auropunctata]
MLRYVLMVFLCVIQYCMASETAGTDTLINGLIASGKLLPNANGNNGNNENLTPAQQIIYIYGPRQWKIQESNNFIEKAGNDYLMTPGMGAHKLHVRKLPWNKARRICIQEGGHLAIINSNSEEKLLLRILEENKVTQAWLGVHDLYEEGDWNTIMDEPLEAAGYSKWTLKIANEPDNYGGKQNCGALLKDGGMDDIECTVAVAFFCEIAL